MERTLAWARLSLRQVETRAAEHGKLPRSTLSYTLKHRKRVPTENQLRVFVYACRIDNHWESWRTTQEEIERESSKSKT